MKNETCFSVLTTKTCGKHMQESLPGLWMFTVTILWFTCPVTWRIIFLFARATRRARSRAKHCVAWRPWQTRTHHCRLKCIPVCPRAQHLLRTQKITGSDFVQKHFVSATNVSPIAQPKKHHGQRVRNNVSSFTRALIEKTIWQGTLQKNSTHWNHWKQ